MGKLNEKILLGILLLMITMMPIGCSESYGVNIGFSYGTNSRLRVAVGSE